MQLLGSLLEHIKHHPGHKFLALSAFVFSVSVPSLASATAIVSTGIHPEAITNSVIDPVEAQSLTRSNGKYAEAYANSTTGILRAAATGPQRIGGGHGIAYSAVNDTLTFTSGFGGVAYIDWALDGFRTFFDNNVEISLAARNTRLGTVESESHLWSFDCAIQPPRDSCTENMDISRSGTFSFNITPDPVTLQITLFAVAWDFGAANLLSTGYVYLRAGEGVSFTSESGRFLTEAKPILPVASPGGAIPSPSPWMLMLAAPIAAVLSRRRFKEDLHNPGLIRLA
jgi:hypothetical protein